MDMSERKKGWKCMNLETKKRLVSTDVVFDEATLYHKKDGAYSVINESFRPEFVELPTTIVSSSNHHVTNVFVSLETNEQENEGVENSQTDVVDSTSQLRKSSRNIVKPVHYRVIEMELV